MPQRRHKKIGKKTAAQKADIHKLYEQSVQCVEAEIDMVDDTYKEIRGRRASFLREDFCGTANTSCEWIRRRKKNNAVGIDLDGDVLNWGKSHHIEKMDEGQRQRIRLLQQDVMNSECEPADIILAMNFSYQLFKTRAHLRGYFEQVNRGLREDGIFFLDAYGGYDSWRTIKEQTDHDGFKYIWDQAKYNPINGHMLCYIHFRFDDGSQIKRALTYNWRMWTLPELTELLYEAGFTKVTVWWEGTDEKTGEGDGTYFATDKGEDDPSWVIYISAEK